MNCDAPINTVKGANAAMQMAERQTNESGERDRDCCHGNTRVTRYRYETTREERHQIIVHRRETDTMDCIR